MPVRRTFGILLFFLAITAFFLTPKSVFSAYYTSTIIPASYENYGTPQDLITLPNGDMWYADSGNSRIVKISTTGEILRTVGRSGSGEGEFPDTVNSLTRDADGYLYVLDYYHVYKLDFNGGFIKSWGYQGDTPDTEELSGASAIHYSSFDNILLVSDTNHNRLAKFDLDGTYLGEISSVGLNLPTGLTTDSSGNIYVADTFNHQVQVFSHIGTPIRVFGSHDIGDYYFDYSKDVEVLSSGEIIVTSQNSQKIKRFDATGTFINEWGIPGPAEDQLTYAGYLTQGNDGSIWLTDWGQKKFVHYSNTGTYLETIGNNGSTLGKFSSPHSVDFDTLGNMYILDSTGRVQKFDSNGANPTTLINDVKTGPDATNELAYNIAVSATTPPKIFVSQSTVVAVFDEEGNLLGTLGNHGLNGANIGTGDFNQARGMDFDSDGNIHITDLYNNRVQKFDPTQIGEAGGGYLSQKSFLPTAATWTGEWQTGATAYSSSNGAWYEGDYYISQQDGNVNNTPEDGVWWHLWAGDIGVLWLDDYTYAKNDSLWLDDSTRYISKQNGNLNHPVTDTDWWGLVTDTGDWVGDGVVYDTNDAVLYLGDTYISKQNTNSGHLPTDTDWWDFWTATGDGEIRRPEHIYIDGEDNLYVSSGQETGDSLKVQKYNSLYVWQSVFLDKYSPDLEPENYIEIGGIFMDQSGKFYVADSFYNQVHIYNTDGSLFETFGTSGSGYDQYDRPSAVKINPLTGDITVVDTNNNRVQTFVNGVKIKNLTPSADVLNVSNSLSLVKNTVDPSLPASENLNAQLYFGDYIVSDFNVDLTLDRDWVLVNTISLPDQSKSLIVNLNPVDALGVSPTHSLYIVKQQGQTSVTICPLATSISELTLGCTDGYTLAEGDPTLSTVTIDSQDYWKVTGLTGTGGFSPIIKTYNLGLSDSDIEVDEEISLEVTAKDDSGITETDYTGTVHFSTIPSTSTTPGDYSFIEADNGVHTFNGISFSAAGTYDLTITDTLDSSRTQTISVVVVSTPSPTPTPTDTPADNTSNDQSSSSSSQSTGSPVCHDQKPGTKAPYIWKTESLGNGKIKLYFTDADRPITDYHLVFGTKSGKYVYGGIGVARFGDQSIIVSLLKPNTKYYFKLIPYNGCASGTWSNEVAITSGRKMISLTTNINKAVTKVVDVVTGKTEIESAQALEPTPTESLISPIPKDNQFVPEYKAEIPKQKDSFFTKVLRFFGLQ